MIKKPKRIICIYRKGGVNMENVLERPCTPSESLRRSLREMRMIRQHKLPKRNLDDFLDSLEKETEDKE
jgi:hypothetical protein